MLSFFFFFAVLGLELRALSHGFFEVGFGELFAWLASNHDLPDLCCLSS
jgi:hypothetical protein